MSPLDFFNAVFTSIPQVSARIVYNRAHEDLLGATIEGTRYIFVPTKFGIVMVASASNSTVIDWYPPREILALNIFDAHLFDTDVSNLVYFEMVIVLGRKVNRADESLVLIESFSKYVDRYMLSRAPAVSNTLETISSKLE